MSAAAPVLRAVVRRGEKLFETAVFTPSSNPESKAVLTGHIELFEGQGRTRVFAFVNERRDLPGVTYLSLTANKTNQATGEIGYFPVAIGNVVNTRSDGGEVFYDTVIFNPVDENWNNVPGAKPISAWVTDACDPALHTKLGFTSARVQRPKKSTDEQPKGEPGTDPTPGAGPALDEGGDAAARAAMVAAAANDIPLDDVPL